MKKQIIKEVSRVKNLDEPLEFTRWQLEEALQKQEDKILKIIDVEIPDEYEDECPQCKDRFVLGPIIDKEELKQKIKQ